MNDEHLKGEAVESLPVLTLSESRESLYQSLMNLCVAQTDVAGAVMNLAEAARRENADISEFADKVGVTLNHMIEAMKGTAQAVKEIRGFGGQPSA